MTMRRALPIIAAILFTIHGNPSFGDEITIFGNEYKPPKYFLEDGKPKGILVDILRYIDQETNHSFVIKLYPWKRAYRLAEVGQGGIIGLSKTAERLQFFDYSDVVYYDELFLVVIRGHEFPFETIEDLAGKRVGVRRGSSYGDEFERGKRDIFKVEEDSNTFQRLRKLRYRRIDVALVGPGKIGLNQVLRDDPILFQNRDEFVVLENPFGRDPNYLGFAKTMKMKAFLHEFNMILQKGYKTGKIQQIIETNTNTDGSCRPSQPIHLSSKPSKLYHP